MRAFLCFDARNWGLLISERPLTDFDNQRGLLSDQEAGLPHPSGSFTSPEMPILGEVSFLASFEPVLIIGFRVNSSLRVSKGIGVVSAGFKSDTRVNVYS